MHGCDGSARPAGRGSGPGDRGVETAEKGKSQGWNALQAYLRRDTEWWFFADADVILHWRALEYMLAAAREHPDAAVVSTTLVSTARFVPLAYRGFLETARVESERLKDPRRMVSARLYAMRREVAETIRLPAGLLNEDHYLTRLLGSDRVWRARGSCVRARASARRRDRPLPAAYAHRLVPGEADLRSEGGLQQVGCRHGGAHASLRAAVVESEARQTPVAPAQALRGATRAPRIAGFARGKLLDERRVGQAPAQAGA